jgi:hypothetical protein
MHTAHTVAHSQHIASITSPTSPASSCLPSIQRHRSYKHAPPAGCLQARLCQCSFQ